MKKLIAIAVAVMGLTGCAASQNTAAEMPGTFMYDCVNGKPNTGVLGKSLEECRELEWKAFDGMVEAFKQGGGCSRGSACHYRHKYGLY